jgi:thiamine pyrophosphate-dependent acetolactate synthase large subunit-like protein
MGAPNGKNYYMIKLFRKLYTEALPDFVKLAEAYGAIGHQSKDS